MCTKHCDACIWGIVRTILHVWVEHYPKAINYGQYTILSERFTIQILGCLECDIALYYSLCIFL